MPGCRIELCVQVLTRVGMWGQVWARDRRADDREVDARFVEVLPQDLVFDVVERIPFSPDRPAPEFPASGDVPDAVELGVARQDQLDRVRVVCVDPQRDLVGLGERGRVGPSERQEVPIEVGLSLLEAGVVDAVSVYEGLQEPAEPGVSILGAGCGHVARTREVGRLLSHEGG